MAPDNVLYHPPTQNPSHIFVFIFCVASTKIFLNDLVGKVFKQNNFFFYHIKPEKYFLISKLHPGWKQIWKAFQKFNSWAFLCGVENLVKKSKNIRSEHSTFTEDWKKSFSSICDFVALHSKNSKKRKRIKIFKSWVKSWKFYFFWSF